MSTPDGERSGGAGEPAGESTGASETESLGDDGRSGAASQFERTAQPQRQLAPQFASTSTSTPRNGIAQAPSANAVVALKLSAKHADDTSGPIGGGLQGLDVPSGEPFQLVVEADSGTILSPVLSTLTDSAARTPIADVIWTGVGASTTTERPATDPGGQFIVTGTLKAADDSQQLFETNPVKIVRTSATGGDDEGDDDGNAVAEVEAGEYDQRFAERTLRRVLQLAWVLMGLVALAAVTVISSHLLPLFVSTATAAPWSETVGSIGQMLCLAVGLIVILLAAWMAMLETRGRQRKPQPSGDRVGEVRGAAAGLAPAIQAAADLAKQLRRVRGLIAVIVVGLLLVIVAAAWNQSESLLPAPQATASPTSTP